MRKQIVIGMSGHIDHGKTSIVKALTGKNTDILDQEKERGMTIDIGFAHLSDDITIIDVPGHEKFIKNMVTGVAYIDLAILVISADDGIMPQTLEHFEILKILNIQKGLIVINKIDLVDEEWISMIEMDIKDLVKGSFLENQKIFKVSTVNNIGINSLKENILNLNLNENVDNINNRGVFRMFVDRVFSQQGFGTVVTGTVMSGSIKVSDKINILPFNQEVRLRSAQSHHNKVNILNVGDRAALNLHGIDKSDVRRGNHLSDKNIFLSVDKCIAEISVLSSKKKSIKQNQRLRFHIGPNEIIGRVSIFERNNIAPGESSVCLIKLEKAVTLCFQDQFLVRTYSPMQTIGGGKVLDLFCHGKWKYLKDYAINLKKMKSIKDKIIFIIESQKGEPFSFDQIESRLGMSFDRIMTYIVDYKDYKIIEYLSEKWIVTKKQLDLFYNSILEIMSEFHLSNPYNSGINKKALHQKIPSNEFFLNFCIDKLTQDNKLNRDNELISLKNFKVNLSDDEIVIMNKIIDILNNQGFNSQNYIQLSESLSISSEKIKLLIGIAEKNKNIIRLNEDLLFTKDNFNSLVIDVRNFFKFNEKMSVSDFKNIAKTSRKYAMPILEYLDKMKITYRQDNFRKLL